MVPVRLVLVFGAGLLALSGCAEQTVLSYQDRPAETAAECEAAYQQARRRGQGYTPYQSGGAGVLGAAIGKGLARGIIESAYSQCLARVAAEAPVAASGGGAVDASYGTAPIRGYDARPAAPVQRDPVAPAAGCVKGRGVMQGGTLYCPGY
jgi:hypothetical protein